MCADIFATVRHPKPTAGISAGISKSARLVAINADMCCIYLPTENSLRECERAKREKHVLNGATMIPLVMTTFGK